MSHSTTATVRGGTVNELVAKAALALDAQRPHFEMPVDLVWRQPVYLRLHDSCGPGDYAMTVSLRPYDGSFTTGHDRTGLVDRASPSAAFAVQVHTALARLGLPLEPRHAPIVEVETETPAEAFTAAAEQLHHLLDPVYLALMLDPEQADDLGCTMRTLLKIFPEHHGLRRYKFDVGPISSRSSDAELEEIRSHPECLGLNGGFRPETIRKNLIGDYDAYADMMEDELSYPLPY